MEDNITGHELERWIVKSSEHILSIVREGAVKTGELLGGCNISSFEAERKGHESMNARQLLEGTKPRN